MIVKKEEKKEIQNHMEEIEKHIIAVEDIKLGKLRNEIQKIDRKIGENLNPFFPPDLGCSVKEDPVSGDAYYDVSYSNGTVKTRLSKKEYDRLQEQNIKQRDAWDKFYNDLSVKELCKRIGMSEKDFNNLIVDFQPIGISYSRYGTHFTESFLLKKIKNPDYHHIDGLPYNSPIDIIGYWKK
jgi:hypothetical protein